MAEDTGIFLADGESAGTTPWEFASVNNGTSNTIALDADAKLHGDYGYKCSFGGTADAASGRINTSDYSELYARFYLKISTDLTYTTNWDGTTLFQFTSTGTPRISFNLDNTASYVSSRWHITGTNMTEVYSTQDFAFNTWIRVDMHWLSGTSSNGVIEVWINGTKIVDKTGLANESYVINRLYVGSIGGAIPASGDYMYFDDIKLDSAYIGAYPDAATSVTIASNLHTGKFIQQSPTVDAIYSIFTPHNHKKIIF